MRIYSKIVILFLLILCKSMSAQNTFKCEIKDSITYENIPGVYVMLSGTTKGVTSDTNGIAVLSGIPNGMQTLEISIVGYVKKTLNVNFPEKEITSVVPVVFLVPSSFDMEAITVTATRNNSRLDDLPIKVEVLGQDEMVEESGVKPGSIASMLMDNSGVQVQQISAASGNIEIKMLGLAGKYTQMLRDGHPLYEGFSGGLGVLSIPPLDLKQVEIIKGSVSTLYGGGAIGGIINFVSKEPTVEPELQVLVNASTLKEYTSNIYYSARTKKIGYSIFCGGTLQKAVDVDKDGFSDVPESKYYLLHPRVFFYFNKNTVLKTGVSVLSERRIGGDMQAVLHTPDTLHPYYEKNNTDRQTLDIDFDHTTPAKNIFSVKATISNCLKSIDITDAYFKGNQYSVYSEMSYLLKSRNHNTVMGLNFINESFVKADSLKIKFGNFSNNTEGVFIQDDWLLNEKLTIESGLRVDYQKDYNPFVLPRIAILYKFTKELSSRINAGTGYLVPNIFSDVNVVNNFNNVFPLSSSINTEKSEGVNAELNYFKAFKNELTLTLNQSVYYTKVENPVVLVTDSNNYISYQTAPYYIDTKGSDTYVRLTYEGVELYFGYTAMSPLSHKNSVSTSLPLTPKSKLSYIIAYEVEDKWLMGVESSYQSYQYLEDGSKVQGYWFYAAMVQRQIGKFYITLNCENVFDFRQNKIEQIVLSPYNNPVFKTLWAPIDGRVVNLALRFKV
ncbi:MAG TPA: TonB-dependent receptor [Bacteroidales bacterium]|nr:TonB-dependent receptor [Bacteroidales bacterium]